MKNGPTGWLLIAALIAISSPCVAQMVSPSATSATPATPATPATLMPTQLPDFMSIADQRLASTKADLKLTPDQEKGWAAVEAAVRALYKVPADQLKMMQARAAKGEPALDPFDALMLRSDAMSASAEALKSIVTAARPLADTMTPEQRIRLANLGNMGMAPPPPRPASPGTMAGPGGPPIPGVSLGVSPVPAAPQR